MTIETVLYLINLFDNLNIASNTILIICGIGIVVTTMILGLSHSFYSYHEDFKDSALFEFLNILKLKIKWLFLLLLLNCFLPSERTMYLMIGANYFKNSSLPPKIELIIEKKLDEYLLEAVKPKDKTE